MTRSATSLAVDELPEIGAAAVTMGVFDGVHRGHRHLLAATRDAAAARGVRSVAIVFDPPPVEVLHPGTRLARLAPLEVNLERIGAAGIDAAVALRFDTETRNLSAEAFVAELAPAIDLRALVMTPGSAFGRDRGGTPEAMRALGARRGFELVIVEPLQMNGEAVSSTRARASIERGELADATALLGAAPFLRGTVVAGDRRGRRLGFPTANLAFDYLPALPPLGVYVGRVAVADRAVGPGHPALVSVGVRPTFHEAGSLLVEVYLLDFDGDLYGAALDLQLLTGLRPERRFESADALVAQMREDELQARRLLRIG